MSFGRANLRETEIEVTRPEMAAIMKLTQNYEARVLDTTGYLAALKLLLGARFDFGMVGASVKLKLTTELEMLRVES